MACTPQELVTDARCLAAGLSDQQLLASIAFSMATLAGAASTEPQALLDSAGCLVNLSTQELLAIIAYQQCQLLGG